MNNPAEFLWYFLAWHMWAWGYGVCLLSLADGEHLTALQAALAMAALTTAFCGRT